MKVMKEITILVEAEKDHPIFRVSNVGLEEMLNDKPRINGGVNLITLKIRDL